MNITSTTQTTFQGGFRLKNISVEAQEQLPNLIKKGRQIFNNFEKENDVFIAVRDNYDHKIAKFIGENKLEFEYYPQISTKSGLDTEQPEVLSKLIATIKETPITTKTQLKKILATKNREKYIEEKSPQYVDNILRALCMDNKHPVNTNQGIKIINDTEFNRKIYISPPSKNNIHYVLVKPSMNFDIKRYAIASDGTVLATFNTPDNMRIFNKRFNALKIK